MVPVDARPNSDKGRPTNSIFLLDGGLWCSIQGQLRVAQLEHGAVDTKVIVTIPVWAIHLKDGLDSCGFLPTQNIL